MAPSRVKKDSPPLVWRDCDLLLYRRQRRAREGCDFPGCGHVIHIHGPGIVRGVPGECGVEAAGIVPIVENEGDAVTLRTGVAERLGGDAAVIVEPYAVVDTFRLVPSDEDCRLIGGRAIWTSLTRDFVDLEILVSQRPLRRN